MSGTLPSHLATHCVDTVQCHLTLQNFLSEFNLDEFYQLIKDVLIVIGKHLGLNIKKAMRKCLVNQGLMNEWCEMDKHRLILL